MPKGNSPERSSGPGGPGEITPIEESLGKEGLITREQLETIKVEQERSSISIVKAVRRLKLVDEDMFIDFLSRKLNIKKYDLKNFLPSPDILTKVPANFAREKKIIPLVQEGSELAVGVVDPLDFASLEELRFSLLLPLGYQGS